MGSFNEDVTNVTHVGAQVMPLVGTNKYFIVRLFRFMYKTLIKFLVLFLRRYFISPE